eukprot:gene8479-11462_t
MSKFNPAYRESKKRRGQRGTPPEPECTSITSSIDIPGLQVIPEFITTTEEENLLNEIDSSIWKNTLTRRVQHYGFIFNYRTLMLDYTKATPPMPSSCTEIANKLNEFRVIDASGRFPKLNQLTVNEYYPGQGIASHTDTKSCFGKDIFILNLGSGIVMNMTKNELTDLKNQNLEVNNDKEDNNSDNNSNHSSDFDESGDENNSQYNTLNNNEDLNDNNNDLSKDDNNMMTITQQRALRKQSQIRKCVYLPARSLFILQGQARYDWSHGISLRKYDKVDGELIKRGRRVSLTFRQALRPGTIPSHALLSNDLEIDHVVRVYDNIAVHWNHTRGKRKVHWHRVKEFIEALPFGSLVADIGSGDGKYFGVNPNVVSIGCDRSFKLIQVSKEIGHETFCCDAVKLPLRSDMFDATLCIAVLHHLSSIDRRSAAIRELLRITKPGGYVMIQAWAYEQGEQSKRLFHEQDTMVPWQLNKRFVLQQQKRSDKDSGDDASNNNHLKGAYWVEDNNNSNNEKEALPNHNKLFNDNYYDDFMSGPCKHVVEKDDEFIFQRYCHVYKEGELDDLCSCVPECRIVESGWDKGNWFVRLLKVDINNNNDKSTIPADELAALLLETEYGPDMPLPAINPRLKNNNSK